MPQPKTRQRRQPAGPRRPAAEQRAPELSGPGCAEGAGQHVLQHAVTATCWLDPGHSGQLHPVSVKFTGRRTGISGRARPGDRVEPGGTGGGMGGGGRGGGGAGGGVWDGALKRGNVQGIPTQGLCIQGFVAGLVVVLIPGVLLAGLPLGTFLDVSAPGLFFAMAIGRQGCVLHGCCTGRVTGSRWGIWASDGRFGARRAPTQQLESLASLLIGLAALLLVLHARPPVGGTVFVGAVAAYTVVRQFLFPYRAEARRSAVGPLASMLGARLVLIAHIVLAIPT